MVEVGLHWESIKTKGLIVQRTGRPNHSVALHIQTPCSGALNVIESVYSLPYPMGLH